MATIRRASSVGGGGTGTGGRAGGRRRRTFREVVGIRVRGLVAHLRNTWATRPGEPAMANEGRPSTMRTLRGLARRLVGPRTAALATREQLLAAIRAAVRRATTVGRPADEVAVARAEGRPPGGDPSRSAPDGAGDEHAWERGAGRPAAAAEPRPEGYFVARLAGEDEARRAPHILTEDHLAETPAVAPPPPEEPGELPISYADDALVALPRDPATLWLFWDFSPATVARAVAGLSNPQAKLRVYAGDRLVRDQDFALESRSFYVNELPPGGAYRAEVWFVGDEGERRVGWPAREVVLPRFGPSPVIDDRFATVPWGMPLSRRIDLFEKTVGEAGFAPEVRETLFEVSEGIRSAVEGGARWPSSEGAPHLGAGERPPEGVPAPARPRDTWSGARYERTAWSGDAGPRRE